MANYASNALECEAAGMVEDQLARGSTADIPGVAGKSQGASWEHYACWLFDTRRATAIAPREILHRYNLTGFLGIRP